MSDNWVVQNLENALNTWNEKLSEIKSEIADMTKQIGEFRKEVKLCDGIIKRSNIMKDKIESVRQEKEERMNEHIRRSR